LRQAAGREDADMRKVAAPLLAALVLAGAALIAVGGSLAGPPRWSPDALFYQARVFQLQGAERDDAITRAFQGPLGAELRADDPERSGDPRWVAYNARFYERRLTVPLAAAALDPIAGERAILDVSLAGYVAAVLALFWLLLLRFRLTIAAGVALGTVFLPALTWHSSFPLTDSWGLALELAALASGLLVLKRGTRWLVPWAAAILVLAFTRDSIWIPILAAAGLTLRHRSRVSWMLLGSGIAAALPALIAVQVPLRELLGQMLNDLQPNPDASWSWIAGRYPDAVVELLRADGGFVRDGAWYSAAYLAVGVLMLFLLTRGERGSAAATFMKAGTLAGCAYVLAVPVFSAFRLELVLVPFAAFGLALAAEHVLERIAVPSLVRHLPLLTEGRRS
jgi:hypothetical protein